MYNLRMSLDCWYHPRKSASNLGLQEKYIRASFLLKRNRFLPLRLQTVGFIQLLLMLHECSCTKFKFMIGSY